jgi:hypothetical protein
MSDEAGSILEPWYSPNLPEKKALHNQLCVELGNGHSLSELETVIVAKSVSGDDVLVRFDDGRLAQVHLTWSKTADPAGKWPKYRIFASMAEWRNEVMIPDHEDYVAS